ncbi:hypothetical protein AMECASPLE_030077 [Ameca splendens]|uniref:Secreted protein n=1 Tax=Ameca splendens TaxID=208324 RepID=A0ABV0Y5T5_9TELE
MRVPTLVALELMMIATCCAWKRVSTELRSPRPQRISSSFASRTPSRTPCSPACLPATTRSDRRKSAPSYSTDRPSDRCFG